MRPDTIAVHTHREVSSSPAIAPLIWQTSTFSGRDADEFLAMASTPHHDKFYSRYGNPTLSQASAVIAALEGTEAAMVVASGMAAISTAILSTVRNGDHVVAQNAHYAGTLKLLSKLLPRYGVETTLVDQTDIRAFEKAIRPNTKLIHIESPTNPLLTITDIEAIVALARKRDIITSIDNTFATPVNQQPAAMGIDIVLHSATKYMGGHSDLVAGAIATRRELLDPIWDLLIVLGGSLDPFAAWLLLRGLRTLPLRVEKHNRNAQTVAEFLAQHPNVDRVHYPGLKSHPQHSLAKKQMRGFGGMVSFEVKGGFAAADRLVASLRLARRAGSLGGVESLVVHPAAMWAHDLSPEELRRAGVTPSLLRMSVGLEDERDLTEDLDQGLRARVTAALSSRKRRTSRSSRSRGSSSRVRG
jgi:cystathionine beta-lyase/cystathionine gamma-synthase